MPCLCGSSPECKRCDGTGRLEYTQCARTLLDDEIWQAVEVAGDFQELRLPPVAGGSLDQSAWFMELCRFFAAETAASKRALKIE